MGLPVKNPGRTTKAIPGHSRSGHTPSEKHMPGEWGHVKQQPVNVVNLICSLIPGVAFQNANLSDWKRWLVHAVPFIFAKNKLSTLLKLEQP